MHDFNCCHRVDDLAPTASPITDINRLPRGRRLSYIRRTCETIFILSLRPSAVPPQRLSVLYRRSSADMAISTETLGKFLSIKASYQLHRQANLVHLAVDILIRSRGEEDA